MKKVLGAGALLIAVMVVAAVAVGNPLTGKNAFPSKTITYNCTDATGQPNGDTITFQGPTTLWPPNHKYRTVTITASESHPAMYSFTDTATANEGEFDVGSGHTPADATPPAGGGSGMGPGSTTQTHMLRAERDGGGTGRTYSIAVDAKFDFGATSCSHTFTVTAPHDMRGGR